ncbi:MAG: hypothetical protein AAF611_12355 [Bacteroidota bacterium]
MKRISKKNLRLNKMSISKLNAVLGGNQAKNQTNNTDDCERETDDPTCTTSRFTVDLASNEDHC